jgi:hypothetical protein
VVRRPATGKNLRDLLAWRHENGERQSAIVEIPLYIGGWRSVSSPGGRQEPKSSPVIHPGPPHLQLGE